MVFIIATILQNENVETVRYFIQRLAIRNLIANSAEKIYCAVGVEETLVLVATALKASSRTFQQL
jgi:hypothetical protein